MPNNNITEQKNGDHFFSRSYFKLGINGLFVICGGILFYYFVYNNEDFSALVSKFSRIMTPFIAGFVIAYLLCPVMTFIEQKIILNLLMKIKKFDTEKAKNKRIVRIISTFLSFLVFLALLYGLIMLVVPQLIINIQSVIEKIPSYAYQINDQINEIIIKYPKLSTYIDQYWNDIIDWFYTTIIPGLNKFISDSGASLFNGIIAAFKSVINIVIGLIIAIYLLFDKEKFFAQAKKILYALLKEKRANNFINNVRYADKIFGGFITGKIIDSIIIGIICYICMTIIKLPYPALVSVIVGVTNIIPYFGPFIGAIPSAFIILMIDPKKCFIFIIFILILQQFDGNILGPKILGNSTGLNSFWVIFAITVFSGLFGVVGMFIGVPLFALIYAAFKTYINQKLAKKAIPVSTRYYLDNDYISDPSNGTNDGATFRFTNSSIKYEKIVNAEYAEEIKEEEADKKNDREYLGEIKSGVIDVLNKAKDVLDKDNEKK